MKHTSFSGILAHASIMLCALTSSGQSNPTIKPVKPSPSPELVSSKPLQLSDLRTGKLKNASAREKLQALANMKQRFSVNTKRITPQQKTGTAANGVKYTISRGQLDLPRATQGASISTSLQNDLVVCKSTAIDHVRQLAGVLLADASQNANQSVIYPGALFKDDDIVKGMFTPLRLDRKPGSLIIDVFNENGEVAQSVANFNDRTEVTSAINKLRSESAAAPINAYFSPVYAEFQAQSQINVDFEASLDLNLAPLIGIQPAWPPAAAVSWRSPTRRLVVAALVQPFYTISVGGEFGPTGTIAGEIPSNAVSVVDVQYGRMAFLTMASQTSRAEASAALTQVVEVGLDEALTLAQAEANLSAGTKALLKAGFFKLKVVGGSVSNAVQITNLETFRNYVQRIDPSVGGSGGVPIAYTLRYAADGAQAQVGAFTSFEDRECFRADGLKVTLKNLKPIKVVDFGHEELFGNIKVEKLGQVASGERTLWSQSSPIQGQEGVVIPINQSVTFNLNPATHSEVQLDLEFNLKDKVMPIPDPEYMGANDAAKQRGYVKYSPAGTSLNLNEIRSAPGAKLTKVFSLKEGDARVDASFEFQLFKQ